MVEFHKTLLQLYQKNVVMMTAKQMAFGRYIAEADSCNIDLEECRANFGSEISYTASLLGMENIESDTWQWSWSMDDYHDSAVVKAAQKLRKLGVKQEIKILSKKSFELSADINGYNMSIIAAAMAKSDVMYTLEAAPGLRAFLILYN